jgi:hypothetical protein
MIEEKYISYDELVAKVAKYQKLHDEAQTSDVAEEMHYYLLYFENQLLKVQASQREDKIKQLEIKIQKLKSLI